MNQACKVYDKKLVLYHYDELNADERIELEAHLSVCKTCQSELQRLQSMAEQIQLPEPGSAAVESVRRLLHYRLCSGKHRISGVRRQILRPVFQAASAVILLGVGFWLGQGQSKGPGNSSSDYHRLLNAEQAVILDDTQISPFLMSIGKINVDAESGQVNISYNTVNEIRITGRPEDPQVQNILYHALLNKDDMALRLRAAKALQIVAAELQRLDAPLLSALEQQLYRERNLGVKLALLDVVDALPCDEKAQNILINTMLYDDNAAVRIQAFKSVIRNAAVDADIRKLLTRSALDSNTYIRTKSIEWLNESSEHKYFRKEQSL